MPLTLALILACSSSTEAPTEAPAAAEAPTQDEAAAAAPKSTKQLVRGRDGSIVEVELAPPWGGLQLPMEEGNIKRISPKVLAVNLGADHPDPRGRADSWCEAINANGGTCGELRTDLGDDAYTRPVTIDGKPMSLSLAKVTGSWTVVISAQPPGAPAGMKPGTTRSPGTTTPAP